MSNTNSSGQVIYKTYRQRQPNTALLFYRREAQIANSNGEVIPGTATITLEWHLKPYVRIHFRHVGSFKPELGDLDLYLKVGSDHSLTLPIHSSEYTSSDLEFEMVGTLQKPCTIGRTDNLSYITFHITNFLQFTGGTFWSIDSEEDSEQIRFPKAWVDPLNEFILEGEHWRFFIATLDHQHHLEPKLRSSGGYGLTHICRAERIDEQLFEISDVDQALEMLAYYLSFARGIWISPVLVHGYDAEDNEVLQVWENARYKADLWHNQYAWFEPDSDDFSRRYRPFVKRWLDPEWHDTFKQSIEWFIEGFKQSGGPATAIMVQQAALERIAWSLIVNDKKFIKPDPFKKLLAAEKLRLLAGILDIHWQTWEDNFKELKSIAFSSNTDILDVAVSVRNQITHPPSYKEKDRNKASKTSDSLLRETYLFDHMLLSDALLKLTEN